MTPFVWVPGSARTIALFAAAALPRTDRPVPPLPLRWPDHQAGATLDYSLDATELRATSADGLSIQAVSAEGITILAVLIHGAIVTVWLGAASAAIGTDATVDLILQTAGGRRVHRIIRLRVI